MDVSYEQVVDILKSERVEIEDIAKLAYDLQKPYIPDLTLKEAIDSVKCVLSKREVMNAIMVGAELDSSARENRMKNKTLQAIIEEDAGLFGVDEIVALSICNVYGSIALTNFGYIDKIKPGIIGVLNGDQSRCNVFMDDIVGAIAASAASRLAHRH
ncbi:MAG: phosphatidylglycerophosphatase A [Bacilli bacterium]|jgi:phosphatidylglycerophosphatase A|nr:phosphatidylglycerophosphatase A [Bacilli bacterium]